MVLQRYYPDNEIGFLHTVRVRTRILYVLLLIFLLSCFLLLPLANVTISLQARGIIRPVTGIAEIHSPINAHVRKIYVAEGSCLSAGDTLLTFENSQLVRQLKFEEAIMKKNELYISDLHLLSESSMSSFPRSSLYRTEFIRYSKKLNEINARIAKAEREKDRFRKLYDSLLISKKEFEDLVFNVEQLRNEKKIIESAANAQWQDDLARLTEEVERGEMQTDLLKKMLADYVVLSPVTGTLESFSGIYPGTCLRQDQLVGIISPANMLVAEILVPASSIGKLYTGMPVKLQVDAFNYNEWGMLQGHITSISHDYLMAGNVPVFKVKCTFSKNYLELKNGTRGIVKKGMTLNAHFIVARRSLFRLIYDKSDNFLNPSRNIR